MKAINIILKDDSGMIPLGSFIEIQDDNGRSIHIGERIPCGGLRITTADIDLAVPDLTAKKL